MHIAASSFIHIRARQGQGARLATELHRLTHHLAGCPGCIGYHALPCDAQNECWQVRGDWNSPQAMQAHYQHQSLQGFFRLCNSGLARSLAFEQSVMPAVASDPLPETTPGQNGSATLCPAPA